MKPYNFIKSEERRFRHLNSIHIRNIDCDHLIHSFVTFHVPISKKDSSNKGKIKFDENYIFKSEFCENSINPSFEIEWHNSKNHKFGNSNSQVFSIRLSELDDDLETVKGEIFSHVLDLSEFRFFSESLNSISFPLPLNTLILQFVDGCFLHEDFLRKYRIPCKDPTKIKCAGNPNELNRFDSVKSITVTLLGGALPSPLPDSPVRDPFVGFENKTPSNNSPTSLTPKNKSPSIGNTEHDEVLEVPVSVVNVSELEKNIREILELRASISSLDTKISLVRNKIRKKIDDSRNRRKEAVRTEIIERKNEEEEEQSESTDATETSSKIFDPLLSNNSDEKILPSKLQLKTSDRLKELIQKKKGNVQNLKSEIDIHKTSLIQLEEIFLLSQQYVLLHAKKMKEKKKILIPEYEKRLSIIEKKLRQRRYDLISEISEKIYHIQIVEKPREKVFKYTINGLGIYRYERGKPSSQGMASQGRLELMLSDETAASLGYVSHCLVMISKILEIQLIYRVIPKSSRSLIVDSDDPTHSLLPLYPPKSKSERTHFFKAVKYLNENIIGLTEKLRASKIFEMRRSERRKMLFDEFKMGKRIIRTTKVDFDRIENNVIKNLNALITTCKDLLK